MKFDTIQKKKTGWPVLHVYWDVQWSWFARGNALCNLSCKNLKKSREVAASLPGWFLSRHWFTLCITVEVEPRIVKQYKCHHCCSCKNYRGKGMEGGKKVSLHRVLANQKITILWKKCVLGHEEQVIACCLTHSDYGPPKMPLRWQCKICKFTGTTLWRKYTPEVKGT